MQEQNISVHMQNRSFLACIRPVNNLHNVILVDHLLQPIPALTLLRHHLRLDITDLHHLNIILLVHHLHRIFLHPDHNSSSAVLVQNHVLHSVAMINIQRQALRHLRFQLQIVQKHLELSLLNIRKEIRHIPIKRSHLSSLALVLPRQHHDVIPWLEIFSQLLALQLEIELDLQFLKWFDGCVGTCDFKHMAFDVLEVTTDDLYFIALTEADIVLTKEVVVFEFVFWRQKVGVEVVFIVDVRGEFDHGFVVWDDTEDSEVFEGEEFVEESSLESLSLILQKPFRNSLSSIRITRIQKQLRRRSHITIILLLHSSLLLKIQPRYNPHHHPILLRDHIHHLRKIPFVQP